MSGKEKLKLIGVFCFLVAADVFLGLRGGWWYLIGPSFFAAWFVDTCVTRLSITAAAGVWIAAAVVSDIPTGFRLSTRIAGVLSLPTFLSAYAITGLIALTLAGLSAHAGRCLRAGLLARAQ